jgi:hypothetical protein
MTRIMIMTMAIIIASIITDIREKPPHPGLHPYPDIREKPHHPGLYPHPLI